MWKFAIINNRLGEIYYNVSKKGSIKFQGYCYVTAKEAAKMCNEERRCVGIDTQNSKIIYRNKKYKIVKV